MPRGEELAARLASVLGVIYLIFNEGYTATAGDDWMRPALCEDALRLGRILAGAGAGRTGGARPRRADGDPGLAIARASRADGRADSCCSIRTGRSGTGCSSVAASPRSIAPEQLAADRGPLHAPGGDCRLSRSRATAERDGLGPDCRALRRARRRRAVARRRSESSGRGRDGGRARRPGSRSSIGWPTSPRCLGYHLLPSVRGDLLFKLGRFDEARVEFERAASMTRNARERELLLERAAACARGSTVAPSS